MPEKCLEKERDHEEVCDVVVEPFLGERGEGIAIPSKRFEKKKMEVPLESVLRVEIHVNAFARIFREEGSGGGCGNSLDLEVCPKGRVSRIFFYRA